MAFLFGACPKDDAPQTEVVVPYAVQYPIDLANIETFLNENTMIVSSVGFDVTFKKILSPNVDNDISIMSQTTYPIKHIMVNSAGVDYKLYYIQFREGVKDQPSAVDSIFVSYKGDYLRKNIDNVVTNTNFETVINPIWFKLETGSRGEGVIKGWQEMFILFKSGTTADGGSGQTNYFDFGAGIMFLPSGMGYYNLNAGIIPAYSPLIFSFKLKGVKFQDHDRDRILSKDEDLNGDGFFTNDDSDGDGIQNFQDIDDDADGAFTRDEIRKPTPLMAGQGTSAYYPFNPVVDNPSTTLINESEPKGIPDASGNGTLLTRTRRHLDKNAKPPYTTY